MENMDIYNLLIDIDNGYESTKEQEQLLYSVEHIFFIMGHIFCFFTCLITFYSIIDIVSKRAAETEVNVYEPRRDFRFIGR